MSESTKTSGTICPSCAARIHFGKRPHLGTSSFVLSAKRLLRLFV